MYNSKLIHILKVFHSEEKERLKKWVNSPAHNHRSDRKKLLLYLISKRNLSKRTTDRYKVYQHIYPAQPYQDAKLKRLMNLAVQLLEQFIHFSSQLEDPFSQQKSLIEFFRKHNLDKYAEQYIYKTVQLQQQNSIENSAHFQRQYQLETLIFEQQNATVNRGKTNLQAVFDQHYLTFILNTLQYACEAITHQRLYKSTYSIPLLEQILADIETGNYDSVPAIQMYYHSYMALKYPHKEEHFELLQALMIKHYAILPPKEIKSIYLIAINYCVQQLNNGVEKYVRAVFELYQYGLKHTILIEKGILSRFTYKNIVAAAIRLEEYTWVLQFITQYTTYLEEHYQKPYALYGNAKLLFAQGQFDATLQLLTQVEFDNIFLSMDAKTMLLKIYYEQEHFDALDALLVSFRRFLQRKSVLAYQKKIHENMINLTTKLLNTPTYNKSKLQALRQEIMATNPLTEKPWLLAQIDKL
ncbi:hypothetical protein [Aureispira anguillae]|uniref:Uncharacterized protein n=1 Tax=Aureispira anguillae TaxID=2864201 RepID=A0A915YI71_9BACT|nr:hypothetical protein [Aureispira anguillae]BDS13655.1 hypothetical protein AsAng_0043940 [Aureispira anguillae]